MSALIGGAGGFLLVGWAAGRAELVIDWSNFRQDDALVFLGGYAQLVLAAAVFFQIRTADRALVRQGDAEARRFKSEQTEAILDFVATAANARSLYVHAIPSLRNVTYNHGLQAAIDRAEAELVGADEARQRAHAARFRVEVLIGDQDDVQKAAREVAKALDDQRQRSRAILAWGRTPAGAKPTPDPQQVAIFPRDAEAALVAQARGFVVPPAD
jgi:cellobiose-specific phosphotransferase system component IIA